MNTEVMFSSKTDSWATPINFFRELDEEFHFNHDPCADEFIYQKAEVRFVRGRLKFGDSKNSAPFPSMVVIYKKKEGADNGKSKGEEKE